MADVAIETSANFQELDALRAGPFWVSTTVGYVIMHAGGNHIQYRKTTDGGDNWGSAVDIAATVVEAFDCWADWQTEGDTGTKIHIAYVDYSNNSIRYCYLDTDGDSVGGDDEIEACQGTGTMIYSMSRGYKWITITKARGGNIAVAFMYRDDASTVFYGFYTSPDGDTWTSESSPWEAYTLDWILLFPGNETDDQDLWAVFWDATANEISLKTYDDSGDSWSEQSIASSMTESNIYLQMDGQVRISDGHLILAAWNLYDNASADLKVWDINGASSITAKTDVLTDSSESFLTSVFIDPTSDDVYVVYARGTAIQSDVAIFYKKSSDGGSTWGSESSMQADGEDDERWVSAGCMSAAWGGKFQPFWFNDDLLDLFTNTDNGVELAAGGAQTITMTAQIATGATMYAPQANLKTEPGVIATAEAINAPVVAGPVTIGALIPTGASIYAPQLDFKLYPGYVATAAVLYAPQANLGIALLAAIATGEAIYAPSLGFTIEPGNIASAEAIYEMILAGPITTDYIATAEAMYAPQLNLKVEMQTIATGEALHAPQLNFTLYPSTFIDTGEAIYEPVVAGPIIMVAIPTSEAIYEPQINLTIFPIAIATEEDIFAPDVILAIFAPAGLEYIVELHDSSGDLVAILEQASQISWTRAINEAPLLSFVMPGDDEKIDGISNAYEFWLRNYYTGEVLGKFRMYLEKDEQ